MLGNLAVAAIVGGVAGLRVAVVAFIALTGLVALTPRGPDVQRRRARGLV